MAEACGRAGFGAAGVMIAPVPSLRTDDQITGYYRQAVEAIGTDIPFVIQDYPLTLSVQMTPKVIRQMVQEWHVRSSSIVRLLCRLLSVVNHGLPASFSV